MEAIAGVLETLKINNTIWIQLICFLLAYLSLSNLIFKPYGKALKKRREGTVGREEHAERVVQETKVLTSEYESKAKEINSKFKTIYNNEKNEAMAAHDKELSDARVYSQKKTEELSAQIKVEAAVAEKSLNDDVPKISMAIASKLIGKEIS